MSNEFNAFLNFIFLIDYHFSINLKDFFTQCILLFISIYLPYTILLNPMIQFLIYLYLSLFFCSIYLCLQKLFKIFTSNICKVQGYSKINFRLIVKRNGFCSNMAYANYHKQLFSFFHANLVHILFILDLIVSDKT